MLSKLNLIHTCLLFTAMIVCLYLGIELRVLFFNTSVANLPTVTDEALNMLMAQDIALGNFPLLFWTQPYQFPLEAYFLSLFINILPADAFGARILLALISCLSVLGFIFILLKADKLKNTWPAILLILIPSTYFTIRQTAFIIPQYTSTITFAWLIPLLFLYVRQSTFLLWSALLGFICGLSLSIHLLSLPIVATAAVACCLGSDLKNAFKNTATFLPGFLIGLLPFLLVFLLPNAYEKVADTVPLADAIERLWNPILTQLSTVTLGINPAIFPDRDYRGGPFEFWLRPFLYFFIACLIIAVFLRAARFCMLIIQKKWPVLELHDIMIGSILLTLIAAAFAGFGVKYRYLLPIAWYFPFLIYYFYSISHRYLWRLVFTLLTISLTYVNYHNNHDILKFWSNRHFAYSIPQMPRLAPLIRHFEEHNITHCYASWWLVYRINYESQGKIKCTQPWNERFPGWPLTPVDQEVRTHSHVPYVILKTGEGYFHPKRFLEFLEKNHIAYDKSAFSHFFVFSNFRHKFSDKLTSVNARDVFIKNLPEQGSLDLLMDKNLNTSYTTSTLPGQAGFQIDFKKPTKLSLVRLYVPGKDFYRDLRPLNVSTFNGQNWEMVHQKDKGLIHRLNLAQDEKLKNSDLLEVAFGFDSKPIESLKINLTRDQRKRPWEVFEIELFSTE